MSALLSSVDPDGLLEYSVVFTDRSLNHMSGKFQQVMNDLSTTLKSVYQGESTVLVPGGGTYAMESVARQFAGGKKCLVIRNGWFSYRWTQIFDAGNIPAESTVLKAARISGDSQSAFAPAPVEQVVDTIRREKPDMVFAPHVETSSGMLLPDDYLREVTAAVRDVGGLTVLDCIASGAAWVDMTDTGIDILISAPQKGWSASPCCGIVMLGERALEQIVDTRSSSFSMDLAKWLDIMRAYENGGHAYHATMPTDALTVFRDSMGEIETFGFAQARDAQWELGRRVRALLAERGFPSVAAEGFEAPGVVVSYTTDAAIQNGSRFAAAGMQIAAGVPLMCDEPEDYRSFRIGLFGLDKLSDIDRSVNSLAGALDTVNADA